MSGKPAHESDTSPVADDAAASHLLREAIEAGVEVISFAPLSGTLEETYLALEGERR